MNISFNLQRYRSCGPVVGDVAQRRPGEVLKLDRRLPPLGDRLPRRPRAPRFQLFNWERGARVPMHFLELCEWFRDCSQASGASQRVQRACAPRSTGLRSGWPCTAWPTARPQPGSCFAEFARCAPALLRGFTPLPVRCASVRRRTSLSVLRAARGQRVLCGTEWTLCAPTGGAALLAGAS